MIKKLTGTEDKAEGKHWMGSRISIQSRLTPGAGSLSLMVSFSACVCVCVCTCMRPLGLLAPGLLTAAAIFTPLVILWGKTPRISPNFLTLLLAGHSLGTVLWEGRCFWIDVGGWAQVQFGSTQPNLYCLALTFCQFALRNIKHRLMRFGSGGHGGRKHRKYMEQEQVGYI
jgi:hypothetical protein